MSVDPLRNRFKEALTGTGPLIGFWTALGDPAAVEICAGAGFDWLLLDMEHAPADLASIRAGLLACEAGGAAAVVRPPSADPVWIKRLLDLGAQTLLLPMVESAAEAAALAAAAHYPPKGTRGVAGQVRAARWGGAADYWRRADATVCLLVQIESRAGLEHAAAIAAVDGVDGVFIGPADLAASLGELGRFDGPALADAMARIGQAVRAAGKPLGTLTPDEAVAKAQLAAGYRFVAVGMDTLMLAQGTRALKQRFGGG